MLLLVGILTFPWVYTVYYSGGHRGNIGETTSYHQVYTTQETTCGIQAKLIDTPDMFYPREHKGNKD